MKIAIGFILLWIICALGGLAVLSLVLWALIKYVTG